MKRVATLIIAALCLGGCKRPPQRHCAEFDAAEARFNELTAQILDPTFGDPRFGEAASLFEAVPEDCKRRETGLTIARAIREGLAKRRAEAAAAAAAPPPPPPPVAAPPPAPTEAAPPMPKVPAPPPVEADDEAPSAEQCAAVAADYRAKCPGECRARKLRDNDAECRQACEQALAAIFQVGGCPPPEPLTQPAAAPPPKSAPPPSKKRAPPSDSKHMTYCAYFLPDGEHHVSDCWPLPLAEAQRSCDERLKAQKIEGTCACNDDPSFMGDRCK